MQIEKNTVCYTSEIGHNNFWYPSHNEVFIKEKCEVERLSWISGGSSIAIKILKSNLVPRTLSENTTKYTSPPTKNDYTIVWIEKCSTS